MSRILHAPGTWISRTMGANMPAWCKLPCTLPSASCWAAYLRASCSTFRPLASLAAELHALAEEHLPAKDLVFGYRWPKFWRTRCICSALASKQVVWRIRGDSPSKDYNVAQQLLDRKFGKKNEATSTHRAPERGLQMFFFA